jgi:hypothetical protein
MMGQDLLKIDSYEEYSYCSRVCNEIGRVDEELSEAFVEDWREYYLGKNAG